MAMMEARGILEGQGIPVTVSLLEVCSTAVDTFKDRRVQDKNIGDQQLVREIAQNIIKNIGQYQAIVIVADNNRLSAWRKAAGPERPTRPSVEDLCLEIVQATVEMVLTAFCQREVVT